MALRNDLLTRFSRRPLIMGIVNATPDSFSGDGLLDGEDQWIPNAVEQCKQWVRDGADILDIGGESTRPDAVPVDEAEEMRRVLPLIEALHCALPQTPLSIDTTKPAVAAQALLAGACILNDIAGSRQDPQMRKLAAKKGAYLVQTHNQAHEKATSQTQMIGGEHLAADDQKSVARIAQEMAALAQVALDDGVEKEKIILDPGIGFGKTLEQNLSLIAQLDTLAALGFPLLVGASRKSFIGRVLDLPPEDRLEGTAAVTTFCTFLGASIVRVHDVRFMARVARMSDALIKARPVGMPRLF